MLTQNQQGLLFNEKRIETYNKGYGGRGFTISPKVIEFRRTIKTEYAISD
jgi:hypothetical protein